MIGTGTEESLVVGSKWQGRYFKNFIATVVEAENEGEILDVRLSILNTETGEVVERYFSSTYVLKAYILVYLPISYRLKNLRLDDYDMEEVSLTGDVVSAEQTNKELGKQPFYIGISGKARSGKDTLAKELYSESGTESIAKRAFADPIKEMITTLGIEDIEKYKTLPHPLFGVTSRELMQTLGDWGKQVMGADVWITSLSQMCLGEEVVIVSDVRYENEANFIRENGILIHIDGRGGIESKHDSEDGVAFKLGDLYIDNSSGIENLCEQAHNLLRFTGLIAESKE